MTPTHSHPVCSVCEIESELTYKCSNCNKPFDGEGNGGGGRSALGGSE